jgi:hypothetical protein
MLLIEINGFHFEDFLDDGVFPFRSDNFPVFLKLFAPLFKIVIRVGRIGKFVFEVFHGNVFHKNLCNPGAQGSLFVAMAFRRVVKHH